VDYTNKWSNSMPAAIGGKWYIYYKGSYPWSHFEAPAAKSVDGMFTTNFEISISPNPFSANMQLTGTGLSRIKTIRVLNLMGQVVESMQPEVQYNRIVLGKSLPSGVYVLQIIGNDNSMHNYKIIKK
ncbi:MAG: T9SS type A sorting domain-containing protein, partial [Bacteroidales bacterium]